MNKIAIVLSFSVLGGCAQFESAMPRYDTRFGDAVRGARHAMTINPNAGKTPDPVAGLDGVAARETIGRYHDSFKTPPPVVPVINIGGRIGTAGGQ